MSLYESMELEVIAVEQNWRVANNHTAADLAGVLGGRSADGIWSHCEMMLAQVCNGMRGRKISKKRKLKEMTKWMPNPAILRSDFPEERTMIMPDKPKPDPKPDPWPPARPYPVPPPPGNPKPW